MAQNIRYTPGHQIPVVAPYAVKSGEGVALGGIFGVAEHDAAAGEPVTITRVGVAQLAKAGSQAWTVGALVYWDAATKRCTSVATGNRLIGTAYEAVGGGAGETIGWVVLDGAIR